MTGLFRALVVGPLGENLPRTVVTLVAVALGVAIGLAIDLANATAIASFSSNVETVASHVNLQVEGIGGVDERVYPRILAIAGVRAAAPVVDATLALPARRGAAPEIVRVVGVDLLRPLPGTPNGPAPNPALLVNGHGAIVDGRLAAREGWRRGDVIRGAAGARAVALPIAAILGPGTPGVDQSEIFVDVATAQEAFGAVGRLDRIDVEADPSRLDAVTRAVTRLLPPGARAVRPRVRLGEISRMLQSFQLNLEALAFVALLVGMYLVANTVAISVVQRRPEIGTVRALGATRRAVFATFLAEGALVGGAGAIAGLALGAALATGAVGAVTRTVSTLYVTTHADRVAYDPRLFVKAFALGMLAAIVAAVVPALDAAATPPAIAMRDRGFERRRPGGARRAALRGLALLALAAAASRAPAIDGIPVFGYASGLLIVFGGSLFAPLAVAGLVRAGRGVAARRPIVGLAAANLGGSSGRVAVAVASLAVAIAMMVAVSVLVGSFRATVIAWADQTLRADLFVAPSGPDDAGTVALPGAAAARIARLPGVADVETFRGVTVPFRGRLVTLGTTDLARLSHQPLQLLGVRDRAALSRALTDSREVLASEPFAERFGVGPGDAIVLPTPSGPQRFTIAAVYNDYSSDAGIVLVDRRTFSRLFHDDRVDSAAVYVAPGADLAAVRTAIYRALSPLRIDVRTNRELRALVLAIFDRTFAITYALDVIAIAIAVLGVVSTLVALVLERRREFGILRMLGVTIGEVRATVLTEAAGIGLLGALLGVALGMLLALLLIFVINRQAFGWLITLDVPGAFLIETVALAVVAAVLAGVSPAGIAARIRTAEALRRE